jgi:hypothetical protein
MPAARWFKISSWFSVEKVEVAFAGTDQREPQTFKACFH